MGIPIQGYERYTVDERGRVYSLISERYLKPNITKSGYCSVELFDNNGKSKRLLIHRLVATAFIPNPNNYNEVNHKDENPSNNHVDNLEWCTHKYNMNYGNGAKTRHSKINYHSEKMKAAQRRNGIKTRKPVLQFTKDGNFIMRYDSALEASKATGANYSHIGECCNGKRYKTVGGFIWKFDLIRKD